MKELDSLTQDCILEWFKFSRSITAFIGVYCGVVRIQCELVKIAKLDCPDEIVNRSLMLCSECAKAAHNRALELFYKEFLEKKV